MQLFGSTTSPFVRRLRLYLNDRQYEFINLDIFSAEGRAILTKNNPALKVPALVDGDQCIYDSRVIYRYLAEKFNDPKLTWSQENLLTLIDAANDSLVSILICMRSDLDVNQDKLFFNLQHERVSNILTVLDKEVADGVFNQWNYPAICLFCLLDWVEFRQLHQWKTYTHLVGFYQRVQNMEGVESTDPR
ncbi:MAG: glutathione S-transferase family protein [Alteromonadaceae bacterium]|nr:glutathione S-transferase family protein [Alteromonadaceae bacterium]